MSRMNKTMRKGKEAMQEWESRGATKTVKQIAVRIAVKKKPVENEEYLALYTRCPPPFFIILVSLAQVRLSISLLPSSSSSSTTKSST